MIFCQSQQNSHRLCALEFGYNDFNYIVISPIAMIFVNPTE